eukprot:TRINITY_DN25057_c0_g2_i1.p1 TRINITY_DN25057_c0_g2~~TRINITY_DN25057_c0_g2_i1.p1  ORF type:complete len:257 (+),score=2.81 TRINITY_DN25057_c0_g2_i1:53-772(+)
MAECFRQHIETRVWPSRMPTLNVHKVVPVPFATRESLDIDVANMQGARLILHYYLSGDVPRALWLDTDTIVRADLGKLFRMRMTSPVAAQKKTYGTPDREALWSLAAIWDPTVGALFRDPDFRFFGSGVFLADLREWRAQSAARIERLVNWSFHHPMGYGYDQVLMNIEFQDNVDSIDWRWNTDRLGVCAACVPVACIRQARILHWSGPWKPWKRFNHSARYSRHARIFYEYAPLRPCM